MLSIVTGAQFGDEGKGKLVDRMTADADIVVRYQGGDNAGHTVVAGGTEIKLRLVPSGVLHGKRLLIGPGVVFNPSVWAEEMEMLADAGVAPGPDRLGIDAKTSVLMPYHRELDRLQEEQREDAISTTKRGIGFAYQDKVGRDEIRVEHLVDPDRFGRQLERILPDRLDRVERMGGDPDAVREEVEEYRDLAADLAPHVTDVSREVHEALDDDRHVLVEGAQGTFLDVLHGTQKYVTSSHTTVGGACAALGVGPRRVDNSIGVLKAYITRVGSGPLPTGLEGETGDRLREQGDEFGTNTGRPRRCGWLDLPLARKAIRLNGYSALALTKLDILSGFDTVKVCTGYRADGTETAYPPETTRDLEQVEPVYEELPGWSADITAASSIDDLPDAALQYVEHVESELGVPVTAVSVGPDRDQTLFREQGLPGSDAP
ncbi:MAG: adenylosuccinate synthase [Candidatus Nanohaloarchaea archaeon]